MRIFYIPHIQIRAMSDFKDRREIRKKILSGVRTAIRKLIEERAKENGVLIVSENGKIVKVSAKKLLKKAKRKSK